MLRIDAEFDAGGMRRDGFVGRGNCCFQLRFIYWLLRNACRRLGRRHGSGGRRGRLPYATNRVNLHGLNPRYKNP